jgi:chromosome segregation ATPase
VLEKASARDSRRGLEREREWAAEVAAERARELEHQVERQRGALRDLVVASDSLASDNLLLSEEVVALRGEVQEGRRREGALAERLATLQELYLAGAGASEERGPKTVSEANRERFWEEISADRAVVRAQPPPEYPRGERPERNRRVAHLKKERDTLKRKVSVLSNKLNALASSHDELAARAAAQQRAAKGEAGQLSAKLVGALRRVKFLTGENERVDAALRSKSQYIATLEKRLLATHKRAARNSALGAGPATGGVASPGPRGGADSDDSDEEAGVEGGRARSALGGPLWTPPRPTGGTAAGLGTDAASLREKILQGSEVDLHEIESFSQRLQALHHRSALSSQA